MKFSYSRGTYATIATDFQSRTGLLSVPLGTGIVRVWNVSLVATVLIILDLEYPRGALISEFRLNCAIRVRGQKRLDDVTLDSNGPDNLLLTIA